MELLASSINHEVQQFYIHTPTHKREDEERVTKRDTTHEQIKDAAQHNQ
jgi:hypothetical protein